MAVATLGAGISLPTPSFDYCGSPYIGHMLINKGEAGRALDAAHVEDAGDISVYNDAETLTVQVISESGWMFQRANVQVANDAKRIPLTASGAPRLTDFAYQRTFSPEVTGNVYTVDLGDWDAGTTVYIAVHSTVVQTGENHRILKNETAWAEGALLGKGSAMALAYTIQSCK